MSTMGAIELGQLIKQARLRRGWQQQELADRIGVDRGYISTIENGKRNWPQQYIPALAKHLGLSETEMAKAAGLISPNSDDAAKPAITPDDPLYNVSFWPWRKLAPDDLDAVREIVRRLARED